MAGKILVTGGAGYVGAHVNKALYEAGHQTVVLDDLSRGFQCLALWGKFYVGKVGDKKILRRVFEENNIESIIHLAGFSYVEESTKFPLMYWDNNLGQAISLVQAASDYNVGKFVFSSSCAVYGHGHGTPLTEQDDQCPINPYGRTKLAIENMIKDLSSVTGVRTAILRYFNAAGADTSGKIGEMHEPETHLIPRVLRACYDPKEKIEIYGKDLDTDDGTCVRDFVHVSDLAQGHVVALEKLKESPINVECNLGVGKGFSVLDVIQSAVRVTGRQPNLEFFNQRIGDPSVLVADCSRAARVLQWKPKFTSLDEIVASAWKWHEKKWNEQG
jgi:UDP-glucose 4-epimerase